jgi:hypothetical protein
MKKSIHTSIWVKSALSRSQDFLFSYIRLCPKILISVLILCNLAVTNIVFSQDWESAFKDALRGIRLQSEDLQFRTDYTSPDSFRLPAVDRLMRKPMESLNYSSALTQFLLDSDSSYSKMLLRAAAEINVPIPTIMGSGPGVPMELDIEGILKVLRESIKTSYRYVDESFQPLSPEDIFFIQETLPELMEEDMERADMDPYEKWIEGSEIEGKTEKFLEIVQSFDREKMVLAGHVLFSTLEKVIPQLEKYQSPTDGDFRKSGKKKYIRSSVASGDLLHSERTPFGEILVGGYGQNVYHGDALLIIDLGGDDRYENRAGGVFVDPSVSIVIDLSGNDHYLYSGDYAQGSGGSGVGILIDLEGDDKYSARHYSQGAGMLGIGLLVDGGGNDQYSGDTGSQGAGSFGIGILRDNTGNDLYSSSFLSQGFGFTWGFGAIVDEEGNDLYSAGGRYKDWLRYEDHFLSLSQGFGYGIRPFASGGIGIIADGKGNDNYISDIFGQGSSYWYSIGSIVDYQGNDKYSSYQYAQGCGTHLTIGTLLDFDGNDDYVSKGVSQGCGHDLSLGLLYDEKGNDNYSAYDLSQGAGNANGIGVLIDGEGNDNYLVRDPRNTQGYGNFRREYGSIGLFLDLGGEDSYSGYGGNMGFWGNSKYGIGVDLEQEKNEDEN